MNISIFGLGYVGCVGAACLAKLGHTVIGVDVNENKVRLINEGKPTIIEAGIAELCAEAHAKGLMSATTDVTVAVHATDVSFIVVGTPSSKEGHLNLNYIYAVAQQIGEALRSKEVKSKDVKELKHIIAIRSTVLPGTNEKVGEIIAKASGLVRGKDFTVVSNPEFLREGTSVEDYFNPPLTLVGTDMPQA
jgi:GDP-mannose 6-dehydrogenase